MALRSTNTRTDHADGSAARIGRQFERLEAGIDIAGLIRQRRTLEIGPQTTQQFILLSFGDLTGGRSTGFLEVLSGLNGGCGLPAGFEIEPGPAGPYRLVQLCQMCVEPAEEVVLPALTAHAGTRGKIATPVSHIGFLADEALGFPGTSEIVVGVLSLVRPYKFIKSIRVEIRLNPRVKEQGFLAESGAGFRQQEGNHPCEENRSHPSDNIMEEGSQYQFYLAKNLNQGRMVQ